MSETKYIASNGWEYVGYKGWKSPGFGNVYHETERTVYKNRFNKIDAAKKELGIQYLEDLGYFGPTYWLNTKHNLYTNGSMIYCQKRMAVRYIDSWEDWTEVDRFLLEKITSEINSMTAPGEYEISISGDSIKVSEGRIKKAAVSDSLGNMQFNKGTDVSFDKGGYYLRIHDGIVTITSQKDVIPINYAEWQTVESVIESVFSAMVTLFNDEQDSKVKTVSKQELRNLIGRF